MRLQSLEAGGRAMSTAPRPSNGRPIAGSAPTSDDLIDVAGIVLEVAESGEAPPAATLRAFTPQMVEIAMLARQAGRGGINRGLEFVRDRDPAIYSLYRDAFEKAETERIASSAEPGRGPRVYPPSDLGNSERLIARHGEDLRYCEDLGGWLVYDGRRWVKDKTNQVTRHAKAVVRSIGAEAARITGDDKKRIELLKWAIASESRKHVVDAVYLAASDARIVTTPEQFNTDPWLLNCLNGAIDLRTGELRPHDRTDLVTKIAPVAYDPAATCPRWERALLEIFGGDVELIEYVARVAGYACTGDVTVQEFFILHGEGANGKNIFIEVIMHILGDYARQAEPSLLLAKRVDDHPTGTAALDGARFVAASETDGNSRLNEGLVKRLTGDAKITARFMHRDFYEFARTFKIFLATNYRPAIKGKDRGIWRRVRLIPFSVTFVKPEEPACPPAKLPEDPALKAALLAETSGVLNWLIRGCLDWQRGGMRPPAAVLKATEDYRTDMDPVALFVAERCKVDPHAKAKSSDLYAAFKTHSEQAGTRADDILTQTAFGKDLEKKGYTVKHTAKGNFRLGIELKSDQSELFDG
jgi:putative DNA primase/helicase